MAQKFRLSRTAEESLDAIWDDVFERSGSLRVSDRVLTKLLEAFDLLGEAPQAGHVREDLTDLPLKFWNVYQYLIAYQPDRSPIEIVAIIHGKRDVRALFEDETNEGS